MTWKEIREETREGTVALAEPIFRCPFTTNQAGKPHEREYTLMPSHFSAAKPDRCPGYGMPEVFEGGEIVPRRVQEDVSTSL